MDRIHLVADRLPRCPWCGADVTRARQRISNRNAEILGFRVWDRTTATVVLAPCGHILTGVTAIIWTSNALATVGTWMVDPVSALVVGVSLGVGWLMGRHAHLKAKPKPIKPICMCQHHYGTHDPKTGACRHFQLVTYTSNVKGRYQQEVPCSCVRYTGPQPVEQYWVAPTADMRIVTAPRPIEQQSTTVDTGTVGA